jgi:GNAT superfamily N-acetyltransferase
VAERFAAEAVSGSSGGAAVEIRPIAPADKETLARGFERLGEESRYRRFLSSHERLTDAELRYFSEVDHHDHEALVAVDPRSGEGIGVARYVRSSTDPSVAELAVAVVDDHQGRGIGTRLVEALAARARTEGIRRFAAIVLAENRRMLSLLTDLGEVRVLNHDQGTVELTVELPDIGVGRVRELVRGLASGELKLCQATSGVEVDEGDGGPAATRRTGLIAFIREITIAT